MAMAAPPGPGLPRRHHQHHRGHDGVRGPAAHGSRQVFVGVPCPGEAKTGATKEHVCRWNLDDNRARQSMRAKWDTNQPVLNKLRGGSELLLAKVAERERLIIRHSLGE